MQSEYEKVSLEELLYWASHEVGVMSSLDPIWQKFMKDMALEILELRETVGMYEAEEYSRQCCD